jgi:hypothetical protein
MQQQQHSSSAKSRSTHGIHSSSFIPHLSRTLPSAEQLCHRARSYTSQQLGIACQINSTEQQPLVTNNGYRCVRWFWSSGCIMPLVFCCDVYQALGPGVTPLSLLHVTCANRTAVAGTLIPLVYSFYFCTFRCLERDGIPVGMAEFDQHEQTTPSC